MDTTTKVKKKFDEEMESRHLLANQAKRREIVRNADLTALPYDIFALYGDKGADVLETVYVRPEPREGGTPPLGGTLVRNLLHHKFEKNDRDRNIFQQEFADLHRKRIAAAEERKKGGDALQKFETEELDRIARAEFPWSPREEGPRAVRLPHDMYLGRRSLTPRNRLKHAAETLPKYTEQWYNEQKRFERDIAIHRKPYNAQADIITTEPYQDDSWWVCWYLVLELVETVLDLYMGFVEQQKPLWYDAMKLELTYEQMLHLLAENLILEVTGEDATEFCHVFRASYEFTVNQGEQLAIRVALRRARSQGVAEVAEHTARDTFENRRVIRDQTL